MAAAAPPAVEPAARGDSPRRPGRVPPRRLQGRNARIARIARTTVAGGAVGTADRRSVAGTKVSPSTGSVRWQAEDAAASAVDGPTNRTNGTSSAIPEPESVERVEATDAPHAPPGEIEIDVEARRSVEEAPLALLRRAR